MPKTKNLTEEFSLRLLNWFEQNGRHDLPWQSDRSPYRVWISEIMLQQTQVVTAIPYFERFMARFPNIDAVAHAKIDDILHLWTGLGYYARARNLYKAAQIITEKHAGLFPDKFDEVIALPGIGRSTAGAILAQSLGQRHAILDGNVKRVLTRLHTISGWPGQKTIEQQLWLLADKYTPDARLVDYSQAIMDLGATVCTRSKPRCDSCPVCELCQARKHDAVKQYPSRKPKKPLPVRQARMLLLQDQHGQFLLQQRPPSGIWGGLWSFPECPLDEDINVWCEQQFGLTISPVQQENVIRHSFSHFHLDIQPIRAKLQGHTNYIMEAPVTLWYNTHQPDALGLPGPVKQLLEQLA